MTLPSPLHHLQKAASSGSTRWSEAWSCTGFLVQEGITGSQKMERCQNKCRLNNRKNLPCSEICLGKMYHHLLHNLKQKNTAHYRIHIFAIYMMVLSLHVSWLLSLNSTCRLDPHLMHLCGRTAGVHLPALAVTVCQPALDFQGPSKFPHIFPQ